jgi:nicotinate-nucleotide pyrophosphorylase (carboxylating)
LAEDIGAGDHSSLATVPGSATGSARLLVKQAGVLAGVEVARVVAAEVDPRLSMQVYVQDGAAVNPGDVAFILSGPSRSILTAERTLLNFMQRLSGIATQARRYTEAVAGTDCRVLDTRKTTPGLRLLEKMAVRVGGAYNHRFGLYDMVMIKDNHADMAGGITAAVLAARAYLADNGLDLPIEVETRDLAQVREVLAVGGVQRVMLDNFTLDMLREAVALVDGALETEASGGITLDNVRAYAETGVDFVSVGALTHSVPALDLSLKAL